ncbi:hypothetical protein FGG08_003509 [Glutinoglossum americanum]|uniref:Potassium channel tetramerisation-type BTB domain-containing protein n=1 Tax=Glutinoglossum americanum TaxID=1670608 RepID=A0A9P8ID47_9PEZI|nr:hypothetical protein FGG08_003509 [Glutinoglossum americanum]
MLDPTLEQEPKYRDADLVHLDVSGKRFSLPRAVVYKYPFSRLADISCATSPAFPGFVDMDSDVFAVIVNFLRYDELHIPPTMSPATVQRALSSLEINGPNVPVESTLAGPSSRDALSGLLTEEPIPSYEESVRSTPQKSDVPEKGDSPDVADAQGTKSRAFVNQTVASLQGKLPTQITSVREQRIQTLLDSYVQPLLDEQGLSGLYKTTFILVPSNVAPLQGGNSPSVTDDIEGSTTEDIVVGFPSEDFVKLVRLKGAENKLEFWRQPAVVDQLGRQLKAHLYGGGHKLVYEEPLPNADAEVLPPMGGSTRSLFGRRGSKLAELDRLEERRLERGLFRGGWRAPNELPSGRQKLEPGEIQVDVSVSDVSLRVVTDMGLYETKTGSAVILTIEVGS